MQNSYGTTGLGGYNSRFFGGYEDLAVEMVASERGERLYKEAYLPDEVYEYAEQMHRSTSSREELRDLLEEYRMRR